MENLKYDDRDMLVSIVIPTYNRKKVISRAIDSCLEQTYNYIEIVICDDHSEDSTLDFVRKKYADVDNIKLCETPKGRKGANAARNEGIRNASGKFIAFLDSDDYLTKDSIKNRVDILCNTKCGMVYGDVYGKIGNRSECRLVQYDDISRFEQRKYLAQELSLCITSSIMVRKSVFNNIGYLDERLKSWQDDDLVVSVGMEYKIQHCKKIVAVVISSPNSIVKNKENLYQGCTWIVKKHKDDIIKYASYCRYCLWRIRLVSLWARYKEQVENGLVKKEWYKIIYCILDRVINRFFRHIYA